MKRAFMVFILIIGLLGCSALGLMKLGQKSDSVPKSLEPEEVALKFYDAQRTSFYSEAWNHMSPAYRIYWKSFENYVDFITRTRTVIPEYTTLRLNDKPSEKKQDGPEHIMLWYRTTNNDYFFINLIKVDSNWKIYNTGGVARVGDLP